MLRYDEKARAWMLGRLMFRCYRTQGARFGFMLWRWLFLDIALCRIQIDIVWVHKDGCECDVCLPF